MKLTCAITQDLLPLYLDGVASGETAAAVEEHLGECEECRRCRDAMKLTDVLPVTAAEEEKHAADGLKKLRRKLRRKHIITAGVTALALLLAFGAFMLVFYRGFPADSSDVTVEIERQAEEPFVVHLTLTNGMAMYNINDYTWNGDLISRMVVKVYEVPVTPFFHMAPGYTFGVTQEELDLEEPYIVEIVYADKTVTYHVEEEAEKLK